MEMQSAAVMSRKQGVSFEVKTLERASLPTGSLELQQHWRSGETAYWLLWAQHAAMAESWSREDGEQESLLEARELVQLSY